MSELIRELFERHQAKLLNLDYEELKQQFDRHEECFNKRYATFSCFEKEFDVWEACWNTRQSEINKLKAEKAGLEKLIKEWREESKDLCRVDDKYVIGALLSCAERLEEAVRGEHD